MMSWQEFPLSAYAAYRRALGESVHQHSGIWWRRVRFGFYQPLCPLQEIRPRPGDRPWASHLGAVQHLTPSDVSHNSTVAFLLFPEPHLYSLTALSQNMRYKARRGLRAFRVEPLLNLPDFIRLAYPVYCDFQDRTAYHYKADRSTPEGFSAWATILYRFPQLRILGAFRGDQLEAVTVSYLIGQVLHYATVFSRTEARRDYVSDLMLHVVREDAARQPGLRTLLAARAGMPRGLDDFYLARGAQLTVLPALLRGNPITLALLRCFRPALYQRLIGSSPFLHTPPLSPPPPNLAPSITLE